MQRAIVPPAATNDSIVTGDLDISAQEDDTFVYDDLGIKCHLNFYGNDYAQQRSMIRKNQSVPFFGNVEYKQRLKVAKIYDLKS